MFLEKLKCRESCHQNLEDVSKKCQQKKQQVQGTDNVVPTSCRMPELAAEKLT